LGTAKDIKMTHSNLDINTLDEHKAKAIAGVAERFLGKAGLTLPHTQALDLVGVLTGQADWRSLKAALDAKYVSRPRTMSTDEFIKRFKPIKNTIDPHASFDGYAFDTGAAEMERVRAMHASNPGCVWTVVDGDVSTWLASGYHHVNRIFYVLTNVPVPDDEFYEIPYGHDESDKLYEVRVVNNSDGTTAYSQKVYASSATDARENLSSDLDEEVEMILDEGGQPCVYVDLADE
jgi:hypothetical protein